MSNLSQKHGVSFDVIELTPELARKFLDSMPENQRPLSRKQREKLSYEIRSKRGWQLNGVPIIFNEQGQMIDGQHRCEAVQICGKSILTCIIRGVECSSIQTIDQRARKRGLNDFLSMSGYENCIILAAACGNLFRWYKSKNGKTGSFTTSFSDFPNTDELIDLLKKDPEIENSIRYGVSVKNLVGASDATFLHYIFSKKSSELANSFFEKLSAGTDMKKGDPILVLREKLIANREKKDKKFHRAFLCAIIIKAWNHKRKGNNNVKQVHWIDGESFPEII